MLPKWVRWPSQWQLWLIRYCPEATAARSGAGLTSALSQPSEVGTTVVFTWREPSRAGCEPGLGPAALKPLEAGMSQKHPRFSLETPVKDQSDPLFCFEGPDISPPFHSHVLLLVRQWMPHWHKQLGCWQRTSILFYGKGLICTSIQLTFVQKQGHLLLQTLRTAPCGFIFIFQRDWGAGVSCREVAFFLNAAVHRF